jgi:hypothetical protein
MTMSMTETEQQRFERVAYPMALRKSRKAFKGWHSRKQEDAIQECLAKTWDSWIRLVERGGDPEPVFHGLIKYAILWVRYDRKIAGRARMFDVYDFRAGYKQQRLDGHGCATPADRSDPNNGWIDWCLASGDDPADLVAALELIHLTVDEFLAA